jgi:hypothetical protein
MQNRFQTGFCSGIGENVSTQCSAFECAIAFDELRTKLFGDFSQSWHARRDQFAGDVVGINDLSTTLLQYPAHHGFSRGDSASDRNPQWHQ